MMVGNRRNVVTVKFGFGALIFALPGFSSLIGCKTFEVLVILPNLSVRTVSLPIDDQFVHFPECDFPFFFPLPFVLPLFLPACFGRRGSGLVILIYLLSINLSTTTMSGSTRATSRAYSGSMTTTSSLQSSLVFQFTFQ